MTSPFEQAPFIVIWETTQACALACVHCRAEALPHRDPGELTTEEGRRLIDRVAAFGTPRAVRITMTLTAPGCPLHDVMTDWVRRQLRSARRRARRRVPDVRPALDAGAHRVS